ncbi:MAG: AEC family transporter [Leptospirillia bacterium]
MTRVLIHMAMLIALGVVWRRFAPPGLDADATRRVLTGTVYRVFLPALVAAVLWRAPLGLDAARIALSAAAGVLGGLCAGWGAYRLLSAPRATVGALVLAAAFPNATYLGLPVLEQVLGAPGRGIAIQYDLFACTPLLLTVGILFARLHGEGEMEHPLRSLMKVPPLWAAVIASGLNLAGVPCPDPLMGLLDLLAVPVVPLMLFSIGLGLSWRSLNRRALILVLPALVIQLGMVPALVWGVGAVLGLSGDALLGTVLEGAMPSMVLGVVICDRFRLDTPLYAATVTLSTLLALLTLPLWHALAG